MSRFSENCPRLIAQLNEPADVGAASGVTRYLHALYLRREDLQRAFPDLDGPDGPRFVEWALVHGYDEVPIPRDLLPGEPVESLALQMEDDGFTANPWGVNVVGYLRAAMGLGESARLMIRALDACGVPLLPVPQNLLFHPQPVPFAGVPPADAAFPVNLVCLNPRQLWRFSRGVGDRFFAGRHTIGLWWWELPSALPVEWWVGLELVDELWAASGTVAAALEEVSPVPVVRVRQPVVAPVVDEAGKGRLPLPGGLMFLCVFDYDSTLERKNPVGAIEAFSRAFAPGSGAVLVLKATNGERHPEQRERVARAAGAHPDVHLIEGFVEGAAYHTLLGACDCYVSLHRSEGFGLPMATAMALGKPAIATGWSGNLEYMTDENSYLVRHRLVAVGRAGRPYYPEDGLWAEPDIDHAAQLMRRVFEREDERAERGRRAARHMLEHHSPEVAGGSISARLEEVRERLDRVTTEGETAAGTAIAAARRLLSAGAFPSRRGPLQPFRRVARGAVMRAIKPHRVYQQAVDEAVLNALAALEAADRELAHSRAARAPQLASLLATLRKYERRLERLDSPGPLDPGVPLRLP